MIKGYVNKYGEPIIKILLKLKEQTKNYNAIIDTGFNGYLSVPKSIIKKTNWTYLGIEEYELASGELVVANVFLGEVDFNGSHLNVYVIASESKDILIGTKLFKNKFLGINFKNNIVEIKNT